jgi:hypothetical protein
MENTKKMFCSYCEKEFNNRQNKSKHEKICKSNSKTQENILTQQIEFYKEQLKQKDEQYKEQLKQKDEQLKQKDEQLKQKDDLIKDLIEKVSAPSCQVIQTTPVNMKKIYDLSMNLTSQNKVVEEQPPEVVYKNKYDKWIYVECKDALTLVEFIEHINEIVTPEMFNIIAMKSFESKYLYILKEGFKLLDKKQYPIQIKSISFNKEEGYIKTDNGFEKVFRSELYDKLKRFVTYNLKNLLLPKRTDYTTTSQFKKLDLEDRQFVSASILGFEDNDDKGKDYRDKKINTLVKSIIDLCMIPV